MIWRRIVELQNGETRPGDTAVAGRRGETLAARHLKKAGLRIVARNWSKPFGELDIIALDGEALVFVEVKGRDSAEHGEPAEGVGRAKRRKIERLAEAYCRERRLSPPEIRFDVIEILWEPKPSVNWRRDAWLAGD